MRGNRFVSGLIRLVVAASLTSFVTAPVPVHAQPTNAPGEREDGPDPGEVESFVAEHFSALETGGAVFVFVRRGKPPVLGGFGYADAARSRPVDPVTLP